ncbi:unnamed protein product [Pylaiella littoralis]
MRRANRGGDGGDDCRGVDIEVESRGGCDNRLLLVAHAWQTRRLQESETLPRVRAQGVAGHLRRRHNRAQRKIAIPQYLRKRGGLSYLEDVPRPCPREWRLGRHRSSPSEGERSRGVLLGALVHRRLSAWECREPHLLGRKAGPRGRGADAPQSVVRKLHGNISGGVQGVVAGHRGPPRDGEPQASHVYAECLPIDLQETFEQISQELRTPFHGVMGSLEALRAENSSMGSVERQGIIEDAIRCGGTMLSTLNNILDDAKECNNTEVAQDRFLASSPILLTVSAMTPSAASESIELVADIGYPADGTIEVIGDERRVKAIFQNLVTNAIDSTAKGEQVRIPLVVLDSLKAALGWWRKESDRFDGNVLMGNSTAPPEEKHRTMLRQAKWHVYCVKKPGAGVPASDLPHLVAPYRQMLYRLRPGPGLGLHICKDYVDLMHGA